MDLIIVMVGLFMIVEGKADEPVDILFLQSGGFEDACGRLMPEHKMRLDYWRTDSNGAIQAKAEPISDPTAIQLEIDGKAPVGPVTRAAKTWSNIPDIDKLMPGSKVRSCCLGSESLSACTFDGKPLLLANLTLRGGSLEPIEYHHLNHVELSKLEKAAALRPWGMGIVGPKPTNPAEAAALNQTRASIDRPGTSQLFNSIVFRGTVQAEGSATIHLGDGTRVDLEPTSSPICQELAGKPSCMAAVLRNLPPIEAHVAHKPGVETACDIPGKTLEHRCWVDHHFIHNYRLLENPPDPGEAPIPYLCIVEDQLDPNEPAGESRCIPPRKSR